MARRAVGKGFKRVGSGAHVGRIAVKVWQCRGCNLQHQPGLKPKQCLECGRMDLFCHDSSGEAGRWGMLTMLEARGKISDLQRQVSFDLMAARVIDNTTQRVKVGRYVADFVYQRDGQQVIEDFKGALTDLAQWKLRHMAAMGLPVKLTKD